MKKLTIDVLMFERVNCPCAVQSDACVLLHVDGQRTILLTLEELFQIQEWIEELIECANYAS